MKTKSHSIYSIAGALALSASMTVSAQNYGTDILHLDSRTVMSSSNAPAAMGVVEIAQRTQGKASNQRLHIELDGLDTNTVYSLAALIGDDTNEVDVAVLVPNSKGEVSLDYRSLGNGNGKGKGKGKGDVLPVQLNPVCDVRALRVYNTNSEAVLTADLAQPDALQYLVKRNLSTGFVKALLFLHGNQQKTQFRLTSSGLQPTNSYFLVINEEIEQAVTTDGKGRININEQDLAPLNLFDWKSIALWDATSNTVFSAELP